MAAPLTDFTARAHGPGVLTIRTLGPAPTCLDLAHGRLRYPVFLPDATLGVVRALDSVDLEQCGIQGVVMNTFHLMQKPGSSTIQSLSGLHRMSGWRRPIITDSGGFQAYSLIHSEAKRGRLTDRGIFFQPEGAARKFQLTPEKTVQLQLAYGADVVICLDDCTHPDAPLSVQQTSVRRTIAWAHRCKAEFERLLDARVSRRGMERGAEQVDDGRPADPATSELTELTAPHGADPPKLFAVVQGGRDRSLRQECVAALLEIGFDGYGYGGWPLDTAGVLVADILGYVRELVPAEYPLHALGIGHPENVAIATRLGYSLFDSALPTRDARHGRLYTFNTGASGPRQGLAGDWFDYLYAGDKKHIKAAQPASEHCDALCCTRYSLGYLHHLYHVKDTTFLRLATIHNLRFMTQLTDRLRNIDAGTRAGGGEVVDG